MPNIKSNSKSRTFLEEPKSRQDQDNLRSIFCEHPVYKAIALRQMPNHKAEGIKGKKIESQPPMHKCRVYS